MSVKVTVIPFSLFTAYQFLSSDWRFDTPESKMRPSPSCMYRRISALMMEMIATRLFFVYCVSNFECWFLFSSGLAYRLRYIALSSSVRPTSSKQIAKRAWQSPSQELQYNTCRRRTKQFSVICCSITVWPHVYHLFSDGWPHVAIGVFLLYSLRDSFSAGEAIFECCYHPKLMTTYQSFGTRIWPHSWP